ncbi:MAG TPA: nuclear transport factor 2 family protein [Steroidobacteraceae bacterium]|nr:nuclear transport factor 2 family protein [Steroidobacteraceae bacterium]
MSAISTGDFDAWLRAYGAAWEGRDAKAAVRIFSADAEYYWTPLDPPQLGHAGIAAAWDGAVSTQRDITFRYAILAVTGGTGIAKWRADFTRAATGAKVVIEGVLTAEFAAPGKCRVFREWWHSAETPAATS